MRLLTINEYTTQLTRKQVDALVAVASSYESEANAYTLRVSLATLEALERRDLVKCINRGTLGWTWSPRVVLRWRLTDSGYLVLDAPGKHRKDREAMSDVTDREIELLAAAAKAFDECVDPFCHDWLVEHAVTSDECYALSTSIAMILRGYVAAGTDQKVALVLAGAKAELAGLAP